MKQNEIKVLVLFCIAFCFSIQLSKGQQKNNLSLTGTASASSSLSGFEPSKAIDGKYGLESSWRSAPGEKETWLLLKLPGATEISELSIQITGDSLPISDFKIQTILNGSWRNVKEIFSNTENEISVTFDNPILTDRIRLWIEGGASVTISEFSVYGQQYVDATATEVKKILVNQSGYNLGRPKGFAAPNLADKSSFEIIQAKDRKILYSGIIENGKGYFSNFNPISSEEFIIVSGQEESFPFRIGPYWLERVTYRNMVDFMIGARHYVGTTELIRPLSFEWRDGDFFNWALQGMVAMYLANPVAFERMDKTVTYIANSDFPSEYKGLWGRLEPYQKDAPDIIKLIHWDADVKISQGLEHEMQKAELAHFLYAWPYLKQWLPQQNFDIIYDYLTGIWEKPTVKPSSTSQYDLSPEHDLLALKTQMGTTKGEMPPGYAVIPNLMMYEVAKARGEKDAEKYFDAAYRQMEWMIQHLDWQDPIVTKGQRMSEHMTMRAFAYFQQNFPEKAPKGIKQKVKDWAEVVISRSDNFWDFRKYSDNEDWVPPSWNETGNILGFPAALFAAMSLLEDSSLLERLEVLAWSHFDNAFGKNPVGRHFAHKGPEEIEGVDLGWYNAHKGGIGLLEEVKFVFDGSPKSFHYPNNPEVGNLGWTEGWVQFNTAFNMSMAYLANHYTNLQIDKISKNEIEIRLEAPVNLDSKNGELVPVQLQIGSGKSISIYLTYESAPSNILKGVLRISKSKLKYGKETLEFQKGESIHVSYGLGYFRKEVSLNLD